MCLKFQKLEYWHSFLEPNLLQLHYLDFKNKKYSTMKKKNKMKKNIEEVKPISETIEKNKGLFSLLFRLLLEIGEKIFE